MGLYEETPWRLAQKSQAAKHVRSEGSDCEVTDDEADNRSDTATPILEFGDSGDDMKIVSDTDIMEDAMKSSESEESDSTSDMSSDQSSPREREPLPPPPLSVLPNPSEAPYMAHPPGRHMPPLSKWASVAAIPQTDVLFAAKSKSACVAPPPLPPPAAPPLYTPPPPPPLPPPPTAGPPKAGPPPQPQSRVWVPHDGPCLFSDVTLLPPGYGIWEDWHCPVNIELEKLMAEEHGLEWRFRGPNPEKVGQFWNGFPFDEQKSVWGFSNRSQLPEEYRQIENMWSEEGLALEAVLSKRFKIPWCLRGPPNGPEGGRLTWRGLKWRPNSEKWMNSKGDKDLVEYRKNKYGKKGAQWWLSKSHAFGYS